MECIAASGPHGGRRGGGGGESAFEVCLGALLVQNTAWFPTSRSRSVCCGRGALMSSNALRALSAEGAGPDHSFLRVAST